MARYVNWKGERKQKCKRGFATKKEAQEWERMFQLQNSSDMDMSFEAFTELYIRDMKSRLKENTWLTKEHIIRTKILPYFGKLKISEISTKEVIAWQNEMLAYRDEKKKPYSQTYLKTLHNQLSAIFNHAVRYYELRSNLAAKAGNMGSEEHKPKMIVAGASAYPRIIDFPKLAEIAKSVGAYLMVDMAHIAGLVAAGVHPSPVPYADITTTTTHKTLRGPRGGLILCNDEELAKKINKAVFPGTQGGPLMHVIAGKAVCFGEAMKPEFKEYGKHIVENAQALAKGLVQRGFNLVSGGTDNHLMLVDLRPFSITGKELEHRLDEVYITVNKNAIPNDPEKPFVTSGIRVGTPAVTTRGLGVAEMDQIAECMYLTATQFDKADEIREMVTAICKQYPLYE